MKTNPEPRIRRSALTVLAACATLAGPGAFEARSATFLEDFATDPGTRGWSRIGDASLFGWNAGQGNLEVTWDSSRPNSFFRRPLGTILGKEDNFALSFDLFLRDLATGVRPGKPFTFELAVGFHNSADVSKTNFVRGTGALSPNLVEFDYFPDSGFGATVWPAFISTNGVFNYDFGDPQASYTLLELPTGLWLRVALSYEAASRTLSTTIATNGQNLAPINPVRVYANFTDFRVDAFSISSYSDRGSDGSLLAHGLLDNVQLTLPDPPIGNLRGSFVDGHWVSGFDSRADWIYTVERSSDLRHWTPASEAVTGAGGYVVLPSETAPPGAWFHRLAAQKP